MLQFRRAPSLGDVAEQESKELERRVEQQEDFNRKIDDENERRQATIDHLRRIAGLSDDRLVAEQRAFALAEAVRQADQDAPRLPRTRQGAPRRDREDGPPPNGTFPTPARMPRRSCRRRRANATR